MSRTFRNVPTKLKKIYKGFKKVRDGRRTKPSHFCENNHGCPYCEGNRLHKHNKQPGLEDFEDEM